MNPSGLLPATEDTFCSDIKRSRLDLSIPKKEWELKDILLDLNTNRKLQSKIYQYIYDDQFLQPSMGWILRFERGCYRRPYPRSFPILFSHKVNRWVQEKNLQQDEPCKKFVPKEDLVRLVEKHMVCPDEEEVIELLEEIKKAVIEPEDIRRNIVTIITKQVEGLITSLAKHIFINKESIKISKGNRFTPEICRELINRLGLDPYNPCPVLDRLYRELFNFVLQTPRERVWGKIVVEDSEFKLVLKDNAFTFPDLDEIEKDDKWIVT